MVVGFAVPGEPYAGGVAGRMPAILFDEVRRPSGSKASGPDVRYLFGHHDADLMALITTRVTHDRGHEDSTVSPHFSRT